MGIFRTALLWISENRSLRRSLPRLSFIRRAVSRFMPGEDLDAALAAAARLKPKDIQTILTHLGENVSEAAESRRVADHYVDALNKIHAMGLDCAVSVKLTQLGLDLNETLCRENLMFIVERAERLKYWVWIDMEQSSYVDRTLAVYRDVRSRFPRVGVCLQAYLRRTVDDLKTLLPLAPAIRLVKGAYAEPRGVAFSKKSDVDNNFLLLARMLLENVTAGSVTAGIATHDTALIRAIVEEAKRLNLTRAEYEFQLLYGIRTGEQERLAAAGHRVRCLISYGRYWFPWYVRRLAERPANVFFVLKHLLGR